MTDNPKHSQLSLRDFIDSINESSRRTRSIIIFLTGACIVGFAATLNSAPYSWAHARVERQALNENYLAYKLGYIEHPNDELPKWDDDAHKIEKHRRDKSFDSLNNRLIESYVDNTYSIKVPVFGVTFDVNDLSSVAGISFLILLVLLRYALRNELMSL